MIQLEEEEAKDSFDVDVAVTNPEKVGKSSFYFIQSVCQTIMQHYGQLFFMLGHI